MGLLFGNKNKKNNKSSSGISANRKTFRCANCGRPQVVTYYGNNDSWTCPSCKHKNWI